MELPSNPDILHRILEFLGPRSTCLTIGSTNRSLRHLSQSGSLWRIFWMHRCLFFDERDVQLWFQDHDGCVLPNDHQLDIYDGAALHKAALTFRHAIHSLNLESKLFAAMNQPTHHHELQEESDGDDDTTTSCSLYAAYIQTHSMMKLTNLRPVKIINNNERHQQHDAQNYQLRQQLCTQTWPGQLSLLNERLLQPPHGNNNNNNDGTTNNQLNHNNTVTCLNSAEIWCDYPTCKQARCGPQGCLRCYRFLTPPVQRLQQQQQQEQQQQLGRGNRTISGDLDGPGDILGSWRECTIERNYDLVSFVKCDWCSVSLCNDHIDVCNSTTINNENGNGRRRSSRGDSSATINSSIWYKCDECNLSSCPQCISQVFVIQPPQMCHVITAGKKCGRVICSNCIWAVGKEGDNSNESSNIPGGKISSNECCSEVVSIRARDDNGRRRIELLKEKEYCCSKCLRHVEFRWRELSAVFDMFGGLVP